MHKKKVKNVQKNKCKYIKPSILMIYTIHLNQNMYVLYINNIYINIYVYGFYPNLKAVHA